MKPPLMDTPEDIRIQERREGYADDWYDAWCEYQQFIIDQARDEEGRCLRCGSADKGTRFVVCRLGEDPMECDGPFHG